MDQKTDRISAELIDFLDRSPNAFFAVDNMKRMLAEAGFRELKECERWHPEPGRGHYVTRNGSALIAFRMPERPFRGYQIMASHCDSPAFRVKTKAGMESGAYVKLNVERYGGMILSTWLDRPLSLAGRVLVDTGSGVESRLVNIDRDLLIIPSLAIHMNREANDGYRWNPQTDLLPLLGMAENGRTVEELAARELGIDADTILDMDLMLYNRMRGTVLGADGEFIASGRLDDLQCAFASLKGFLAALPSESVAVHAVFDNEEVGSGTKQGAASTFLRDVLDRIASASGMTGEDQIRALRSSLMVSADNAHSVHPNHEEKADPTNRPVINGGVVIKYSANQKYTTDAVSGAVFRKICRAAGVPYQTFANRSDQPGGSTLGNLSSLQVALSTVDVGLAQLAMHSAYETAGSKDTLWLAEAARTLFSGSVEALGDGAYRLDF